METFKKIGIVLGGVIVLLLIVALFVSTELHFEKSITINRTINEVWEETNSLASLDKWSPWMEYDPNMNTKLTGIDGTVGAKSSWDSDHPRVGKGSQTIRKIERPTLFATDLKFYTPHESEAEGFIKLRSEGRQTIVTWGFDSEMPYPFNLMKLIMDLESDIGHDFGIGLKKLKNRCESSHY